MKFVALVSGGKDSIFSIMEAVRLGHELVACVHLGRPRVLNEDTSEEEEESYLYQTAGSETLVTLVEECLEVPLILHERVGKSLNTSLVYEEATLNDEVEDLYQALCTAQQQFPTIEAVCSGAILSTYQRIRIEHVCQRLNLVSLAFLWRRASQKELLQQMIEENVEAILVRVAAPPGLTARHLERSIQTLQSIFHRLYQQYKFSVCGEGGEYETIVVDCPIFRKRLVLDKTETVEDDNDGVAMLKIAACHAESKTDEQIITEETSQVLSPTEPTLPAPAPLTTTIIVPPVPQGSASVTDSPRVRKVPGGLFHISEIMAPSPAVGNANEAELAVLEAKAAFNLLAKILFLHDATAKDVMMVHVYLADISHFQAINQHYSEFFGMTLPPSRSCVGLGANVLPGRRRILLDCQVQCGSGTYMRSTETMSRDVSVTHAAHSNNYYASLALANTTSRLREVLHVQSRSYWAPVCVGPYSQANTLGGAVCFVAGQIGLQPERMALRGSWSLQLEQSWKNAASVLDAVQNSSLHHLMSGLVYVASSLLANEQEKTLATICNISQQQRKSNSGVLPGQVDDNLPPDYEGYEDEGTMNECKSAHEDEDARILYCPLLVVGIPQMPVSALVEVEIVAATRSAAGSLQCFEYVRSSQCMIKMEKVGRSHNGISAIIESDIQLPESSVVQMDASWYALGTGCVGFGLVTAAMAKYASKQLDGVNVEQILGNMIELLSVISQSSPSTPDIAKALHLRLFYLSSEASTVNDETCVRLAFQSAVSVCFADIEDMPATSTVPVEKIHVIKMSHDSNSTILFAIQATVVNPIELENELWVRVKR